MQPHEIDEKIEELVEAVQEGMTESTRECKAAWPLDHRSCPSKFWFDEDILMVNNNATRLLDHFGGFEYIDVEYRRTVGDYTIYLCEDPHSYGGGGGRVDRVLNALRPFLRSQ